MDGESKASAQRNAEDAERRSAIGNAVWALGLTAYATSAVALLAGALVLDYAAVKVKRRYALLKARL